MDGLSTSKDWITQPNNEMSKINDFGSICIICLYLTFIHKQTCLNLLKFEQPIFDYVRTSMEKFEYFM